MEGLLGAGQALSARRQLFLILSMLSWLAMPAAACVNTFETEIHALLSQKNDAGAEKVVADLEAKYRKDPTLEHANDAAVARLLMGRREEAIRLLLETESKYPGKAIVAANLGTAYELSGNLDQALRWIREGVKRDPAHHHGTEWLHVKILEAKLALRQDPRWLDTHSVIGADLDLGPRPGRLGTLPVDEAGKPRSMGAVVRAIEFQLRERTKLVDKPDDLVADLLLTQGDLSWLVGNPFDGMGNQHDDPGSYYERAVEWAVSRKKLAELRHTTFEADFPGSKWYGEQAEAEPVAVEAPTPAKPAAVPTAVKPSATDVAGWWILATFTALSLIIIGSMIWRFRVRLKTL
jgi:tetratricopeptide (TPR) repeat protein